MTLRVPSAGQFHWDSWAANLRWGGRLWGLSPARRGPSSTLSTPDLLSTCGRIIWMSLLGMPPLKLATFILPLMSGVLREPWSLGAAQGSG